MDKRLNWTKIIKLLEENKDHHLRFGSAVLAVSVKHKQQIKVSWTSSKLKICASHDNHQDSEKADWEKIISNRFYNKGLVSRIH